MSTSLPVMTGTCALDCRLINIEAAVTRTATVDRDVRMSVGSRCGERLYSSRSYQTLESSRPMTDGVGTLAGWVRRLFRLESPTNAEADERLLESRGLRPRILFDPLAAQLGRW